MALSNKKVIVILGPTASGKTKLAVKLARELKGEIISADSRQVYRGMDIGTGKDLNEYQLQAKSYKLKATNIPYHLIDIVSPQTNFSVSQYQKKAYQVIVEVLSRGKLPIICGGTGLYISAVTEGYKLPRIRNLKLEIRNLRKKLEKLSLTQLLSHLKKIDPATYKIIDQKNRRRVQRALEIYYQTGQTKSAQIKTQTPPYNFLFLGLTFPKKVLDQRIEARLKHRLEKEKMIDEIARLHDHGVSWQRLDDLGLEYRFISRYLQGQISQPELFNQLKTAIQQFAKRQMTWFKRNKNIIWVKNSAQAKKIVKSFLA